MHETCLTAELDAEVLSEASLVSKRVVSGHSGREGHCTKLLD